MRFLMMILGWVLIAAPATACGPDTDCMVAQRHYRIAMPEGHDGSTPVGAVIWAHGYRGTSAGVMRNGSLRRMVSQAGLALVAAEAAGGGWDLPNGPRNMASTGALEFAYFDAVIADITSRFAIDPARLVVSGFSSGGMMTWNLACARPGTFVGFVPISGTFWLEPPEECDVPVASVVHIHGDADGTVPLDGRPIRQTRQGKVSDALRMYGALGRFSAAEAYHVGPLDCQNRSNPAGEVLEFCLFHGGHSFRTEYLGYGLERLQAAGRL